MSDILRLLPHSRRLLTTSGRMPSRIASLGVKCYRATRDIARPKPPFTQTRGGPAGHWVTVGKFGHWRPENAAGLGISHLSGLGRVQCIRHHLHLCHNRLLHLEDRSGQELGPHHFSGAVFARRCTFRIHRAVGVCSVSGFGIAEQCAVWTSSCCFLLNLHQSGKGMVPTASRLGGCAIRHTRIDPRILSVIACGC